MPDVYLTSTLRTEWNRAFTVQLCQELEKQGFSVYLPQRDTHQRGTPHDICHQNLEGIRNSSKLLAVCTNASPNWGVEVGYAHAIGKKIIALSLENDTVPEMTTSMIWQHIRTDLNQLNQYVSGLAELIRKDL